MDIDNDIYHIMDDIVRDFIVALDRVGVTQDSSNPKSYYGAYAAEFSESDLSGLVKYLYTLHLQGGKDKNIRNDT